MSHTNLKILLLLIFGLCMSSVTMAQSSAQIVVDPYVVQGQNFTVTYRLVNCDEQMRQAPQLKGCQLVYGPGISTYQSVEFSNGQTRSTYVREYSFTYRANSVGKVTIPAMQFKVANKTVSAKSRSFEILPPDKSDAGRRHQAPSYDDSYDAPEQDGYRDQVKPNDLIVTVTMSKSNIYEKEAVIATVKVYTKHEITSFRATTLPSFEGFLSEELDVSNLQPKIEHYNGGNYYSAVLKQCVLYPQNSGRLTINSGQYDVTLRLYETLSYGYMQTRRPFNQNVTTTSKSISVDVKALPQPAPAGFNGAVGRYKAESSLEPSELRTNEAANYIFQITGTGNIKHLSAPTIDFPAGVEVYTTEVDAEARFNGSDMAGTFKAVYPLMPQQVGQLNIPAWDFVYFDPGEKVYKTIHIPAYSRTVKRGAVTTGGTQSDIGKMTDIEHIKSMSDVTLSRSHNKAFGSTLYVICYLIIILILVTATIVYRRQIKINADVIGKRTARAGRVANKRLREARKAMSMHDNERFYALLAKAMWGYISDKLRIPASALTRDNIQEKMSDYGIARQQIDDTIAILDECEMARFTPDHSDDQVSGLYDRAVGAINGLETVRPKSNATASQS